MPYDQEEEDTGLLGKLKAFYYKVEDKYYALLDNLHDKGVDLYKYFVEPIESRGIPSFPVAIALILLVLGGIFFVASSSFIPSSATVTVHVAGAENSTIPVTIVVDGTDFATKNTVNGVVTFENVPTNKQAVVKISKDGFVPVNQRISFSGAATSVNVRLNSLTPTTVDFLVTVISAATNSPVRGAVVNFQSLSTGVQGSVETQPDGTAVLKLDSLDTVLSLNVQAENFEDAQRSVQANDGQVTIQLTEVNGDRDNGGDQSIKGTVIVRVTDSQGNLVNARVELFQDGTSTPLAEDLVESGVARFPEVASIGTSVYVKVIPQSDNLSQYTTNSSEITADEELEFSVQLLSITAGAGQKISITVNNDASAEIPAANVLIFASDSNRQIASGVTDDNGRVELNLASNIALEDIYVAITADGFLPLISTVANRDSTFMLVAFAAGNNVKFDAEVLNADLTPASGAHIELQDAAGRLYGIFALTGPDGKATFEGIPTDVSLRLFATLDSATGQSDVFEVAFSENEERVITFTLTRPVGAIRVFAKDLVDSNPVANSHVTAFVDSQGGQAVSNCTTNSEGSCLLEGVWANRDIYLVASGDGFESYLSDKVFVSPDQTKQLNVFLLAQAFRDQTIINLVSLVDDKGRDILNAPAIEKGRMYTAKFAASFANGSNRQGIFLRVGEEQSTANDPIVIKAFSFTPSAIGNPVATHSTTYNAGSECTNDLLNSDVNSEGKKWVQVDYNGISGVVELTARVFVKPTADPSKDKLAFHYRAFAVQNGKFARAPFDEELKLERRSQGKDECYATTIDKEFGLVEGSNVCNDDGSACITIYFTSSQQLQPVGSPFISTINRPFTLNYEVRSFGAVEGSSAYVKISSTTPLATLSDYSGDGTATFNDDDTSSRVLLVEAKELYTGSINAVGAIPADFVPFTVEFGDARGAIATHSRSFAVIQGTGALSITQLTPSEFEVGKAKDLKITIKTSSGSPVTDATLSFEEESGSPFDGDVPAQITGDSTTNNGENGIYVMKRIRTVAPGTFVVTASRDRFVPVTEEITSKVSLFFEFDQPDFISLSCNSTQLRVTNNLDVELTADIYVDPACVVVNGPGLTQVSAQGGQNGTLEYRLPNFKPGRTRVLTLIPNSRESCQIEISSTDPRTGTRSLDAPIQIENSCTSTSTNGNTTANGIIYINGNVFQPPRLIIDTFSNMFYGSYQPTNLYDPRFPDAASYLSPPMGGYAQTYQRMGLTDQYGNPVQQYAAAPGQYGAVGVPRSAALGTDPFAQNQYGAFGQQNAYGANGMNGQNSVGMYNGQFGSSGYPDASSGGMFDISRMNAQMNWTVAWVNQDPIPHAFTCVDRSGNAVITVPSIAPGEVYTKIISRPGLYKCTLENTNTGTVKIKSMCPKKGAVYYTRLITRCMLRKAAGDSGLFDGGKEHSAKVAASAKTMFTAFGNSMQVGQNEDKQTKVKCQSEGGGASCTLFITPLVPRNGFGFAVRSTSGAPDFTIRLKGTGSIDSSCFTYEELDKSTSYRSLLSPVVSGISAIGLTSAPQYKTYAIKFNEKGNCVKLRPKEDASGKVNFEARIWDPVNNKFVATESAYADFELASNSNLNNRYKLKLIIQPTLLLDGRFLFTTIPTTVGANNLFYRTEGGDFKEPGFVLNNLAEEVDIFKNLDDGSSAEAWKALPNSIGIMDGTEVSDSGKLQTLSSLQNGFYLGTYGGGTTG
ncbi:MAG: hypothetical protein V1722_00210, partial [Candidatus Micrarchaeota archaeon]